MAGAGGDTPGKKPGRSVAERRARQLSTGVALLAAATFVAFYTPPRSLLESKGGSFENLQSVLVSPASEMFGRSGAVSVRFTLPGEPVEYPLLAMGGDESDLAYVWLSLRDTIQAEPARPIVSDTLVAPPEPGLYRLAVVANGVRRVVDSLTVSVLVPFNEKKGATLEGYRIGIFPGERSRAGERPEGFVRVMPDEMHVQVTRHFRLADFLTRDGQTTWPRYAAVTPELLDKLELVMLKIAEMRGDADADYKFSIGSSFRTPAYNSANRFSTHSRHLQGDAIDIAIDVDRDGKFTLKDAQMVIRAVDAVEREHPDLVGGVGLYSSKQYRHPYVHIDARGTRARWRG
jgi:uncharacterized protein YcbK (DUF882 family)